MSESSGESGPPARPRPRPKYGEYATPQEQAEIIAKSMPPVSPLLVPSQLPPSQLAPSQLPPHDESVPVPSGLVEPDSSADRQIAVRAASPAASATPAASAAQAPPARRRRWDLVLSVALLAYGLVTVLAGFAQYSDIPAMVNQVYETQSIGRFTPTDLSRGFGITVILTNVVLFALAAWLTVRRLIAGRIAFWVPLAAGLLAAAITVVIVIVIIARDPAFSAYLESMSAAS